MKATEKQIKAAAKELNELGFEPAWNAKGSAEDTLKWLTNAVNFLEKYDVLTEDTQDVVDELLKSAKKEKAPVKKEVPALKAKKEKAEVVVEDDDEEEVIVSKKSKATPPPKVEKLAKVKKVKEPKREKTVSPTYVVRYAVCENPAITVDELQKLCKKEGIEMQPISISLRRNEMLAAIAILKEQGQMKK